MSLFVVDGSGGSGGEDPPRSRRGRTAGLHLVPLATPAAADRGGGGRHRFTSFALTVDDLIERECVAGGGRTSLKILALAVRRGLLPG
jgi:hypothetical protein